ncbi:MAG: adenine phosphoribosyltransferase [Planctomycetes bacterium]|jgi:adenine phosphoribosyltransferase|nr:adenine phosphoribosyltransferase [Planctomycetota bacterium]
MAKEPLLLTRYIRDIPDWPKKGILFRDITPLLADPQAFPAAVEALCAPFQKAGVQYVAGVEARGFIFGAAVAARLQAGFVPIRKKGKLPWQTESASYDLEYGTDSIEIHRDAVPRGAKVLLVDDLLATGGTMQAACRLMEKVDAEVVGIACVIELTDLKGRARLAPHKIHVLISY